MQSVYISYLLKDKNIICLCLHRERIYRWFIFFLTITATLLYLKEPVAGYEIQSDKNNIKTT